MTPQVFIWMFAISIANIPAIICELNIYKKSNTTNPVTERFSSLLCLIISASLSHSFYDNRE